MIPFIVLMLKSLVDNIENENESCVYKANVFKKLKWWLCLEMSSLGKCACDNILILGY
jgi:hypothetical protein